MSRAAKLRTAPCSRPDARIRLRQAEAYLKVAVLCLDDQTDVDTPGVAASLAVLAAIAAGDSVCCYELGKRSRAQDHAQAEALIATIAPSGQSMSKKFRDVVMAKGDSHYGLSTVSTAKARQLVNKAAQLTEWAKALTLI